MRILRSVSRRRLGALAARPFRAAALVLLAAATTTTSGATALASTVTWHIEARDTDSDGVPDASFYVYTVVPDAGETIKDFHVLPPPGVDQPVRGTPKDPDGAGGPWSAGKGRNSFNWWSSSSSVGEPMQFEVQLPPSGYTRQDGSWKTTGDGNKNPDDGMIDWGPRRDPRRSDVPIYVPVASLHLMALDPPFIGSASSVLVTSSLASSPYLVHVTSSPVPDLLDDAAVESFVASNPVPAEWGLSIVDASGFLDLTGKALFSLVIPDDIALAGKTVYLTAVVTDADGSSVRSASLPITLIP